jgi:hypothetical protein
VVLVLAGGAFAGVRVLGGLPVHQRVGRQTPSPLPTTPPPTPPASTTVPACTSAQLRALGSMDGAAGSREGASSLTNLSDQACTLQGSPAITPLDQNLHPITSGVTFSSSPAGWEVNGSPQPAGCPVVTLQPGDSASVRLRWSNWCPDGRAAPLWRIGIPGSGTVDVNGLDAVSPPPCNGPGLPSTIEVGPFEPGAGPAQPTTPASTTAVPTIPACTSAELRAVGSMQGAAGSREGAISLTGSPPVRPIRRRVGNRCIRGGPG